MLVRDCVGSKKFTPVPEQGPLSDNTTHLGVEVETEGSGLDPSVGPNLSWWNLTSDGSLKSAYPWEFVFVQGLAGQQVVDALDELEVLLDGTGVEYPINTSVHVHMNVGDLTKEQLRRFAYLCVVTESALVQYSGARTSSPFCIPWGHCNPTLLATLGYFLDDNQNHAELPKYTSVNFNSVFRLGTVEFRTMKGTHNKQEILDWIEVLLALKSYALRASDARDNLDYMVTDRSLVRFLKDIWPSRVVQRMMHPNLHDDMRGSSLNARMGLYPKSHREIYNFIFRGEVPQEDTVPSFTGKWNISQADQFFTTNSCQLVTNTGE
jgi:hypothetical protein